jgi:predicted CXXCH cytochrome family protein
MRRLALLVTFLCTLPGAFPVAAQQPLLTRDSKRECATCHLDWTDAFDRPGAVLLIDKPASPAAADEATCRGCHDGSVGDSRREVWLEHGHRVNTPPTDRIRVPSNMPLEDGKMVCRTCHTAHTVPTANDLSKIVFLRAAKEGGLCQQCHVDRAYGAEHTSHPLAKLTFELPKELASAHARTDPADRTKMACQTCHTTHGARQDHLLVMGTSSGQLCLACHEKLHPQEWKPDAPREHPQNPPLQTPAQRQAIRDMDTRLGPDDTLTCFSCHKMHSGKTGKFMLADAIDQSQLCLRCHEERKTVLTSAHDLRTTRPQEKNLLDQTPQESGPCGACHSFHNYTRQPKPSSTDPSGRCATCHLSTSPDLPKGLAFAHPTSVATSKLPKSTSLKLEPKDTTTQTLTCNTCHDPHLATSPRFLRLEKDALCASCHTAPAATLAGKHDFSTRPELKNARDQTAAESGKCGFCHAVHTDSPRAMWVATAQAPTTPDNLCTECHREKGLAGPLPHPVAGHPTGPKVRPTTQISSSLPLLNDHALATPDGFVSCASCHDPHANSDKRPTLLRTGGLISELCIQCHPANAAMATGPHDARGKKDFLPNQTSNDLCTTCHQTHGDDPARRGFTFVPPAGLPTADAACVACHPKQAPAADAPTTPGRLLHPTTVPSGHAALNASLPLLNSDPKTSIGCKTCHDPHARKDTPRLTRTEPGAIASTLCIRCHKNATPLASSMHAPDAVKVKDPANAPACAPCHATHAVKGSQRQLLWVAQEDGPLSPNPDDRCLSCHASTQAGREIVVQHPLDPVRTLPWSTTRPSNPVTADVHCATCHAPHGDPAAPSVADLTARRAARTMVRPNVAPQCAYCHGKAASRLFLYWHQPAKRSQIKTPGQKGMLDSQK